MKYSFVFFNEVFYFNLLKINFYCFDITFFNVEFLRRSQRRIDEFLAKKKRRNNMFPNVSVNLLARKKKEKVCFDEEPVVSSYSCKGKKLSVPFTKIVSIHFSPRNIFCHK